MFQCFTEYVIFTALVSILILLVITLILFYTRVFYETCCKESMMRKNEREKNAENRAIIIRDVTPLTTLTIASSQIIDTEKN